MARKDKNLAIQPKQKRSVKSRDSIFRAAARVFSENGLPGARMDEIARLAGVNKQRIYAYFGSKKGLYRAVLMDVYSRVARNERLANLSSTDIPELTGIIIRTFFDVHEKNPTFWRLLSWENLNGGKSLSPGDWASIRSEYIRHLETLYRQGQKEGAFRGDIGFSTYLMLLFSVTYFYFSNRLTISELLDLKLESGTVRKEMEKELIALVTHGISPGRGEGNRL